MHNWEKRKSAAFFFYLVFGLAKIADKLQQYDMTNN